MSTDGGANYTTLDTLTAYDAVFLQGDLRRNTPYHLRLLATEANGAREIYESGSLSTLDLADTSGWYQLSVSRSTPWNLELSEVLPGFPVNYSGVYAGSPAGAILRSLPGLVTNGSVPTADPTTGEFLLYTYPSGGGCSSVNARGAQTQDSPRTYADSWVDCAYRAGESIAAIFRLFTEGLRGAPNAECGGEPVRYFDGSLDYSTTDLASNGLGETFTQGRSWTAFSEWSASQRNGTGWIDDSVPTIQQANGGLSITIVRSAINTETFELSGGQYVPISYLPDTLVHDTTNGEFIWTDSQGNETHFYDFGSSAPTGRAGTFKSSTDAGGLLTHVTAWTATGAIAEVRRQNAEGLDVESWLYSYIPSDLGGGIMENPNFDQLSSVQFRQPDGAGGWTVVRKVTYDYYSGTQQGSDRYGNAGDLKTASVKDASGSVLSTDYYRYYTPGEAGGYTHGLKYVFDAASYERLCAAVGDPTLANDAAVAPYAQQYMEYDATRRVTRHDVQGFGGTATDGIGTFTYAYFANSEFSTDTNHLGLLRRSRPCPTATKTPSTAMPMGK